MSDQKGAAHQAFIKQQRKRLEALREQLQGAEQRDAESERAFQKEHGGEAKDLEDEAQRMAQKEIGQALHSVDERRLRAIERALQKIEEGTYGLSDMSGEPIPQARLESMPEAVLTVEEQGAQENLRHQ